MNTNDQDYSIHYFKPLNLLIAHMRYMGKPEEMKADMARIGESEETRRLWKVGSTVVVRVQLMNIDDRWYAGELRGGSCWISGRTWVVDGG